MATKKRKRFICGLCGNDRWVRTHPRSPCMCRTQLPNRHMYFKFIIRNFIDWTWEKIQLTFLQEWVEVEVERK